MSAGGRDVYDDRNRRGCDLLDDALRGTDEAAGCIDLDQYSLVAAPAGFVDGAGNIFRADGLNSVIDYDFQDLRGGWISDGQKGEGEQEDRCNYFFTRFW